LQESNRVQRSVGVDWTYLQNKQQLEHNFPWLNFGENDSVTNGGGIVMGSHSTHNEGYFDPWSYLHAMKKKVSFAVYVLRCAEVFAYKRI
jgi:hypothetical protein